MKDTAFYVPAAKLPRLAQVPTPRPLAARSKMAPDQQAGLMADPTTPRRPGPLAAAGSTRQPRTTCASVRCCWTAPSLEWHPTARTADGGDDADQSPVGPEALKTYRPGTGFFGLNFAVVMDAGEAAVLRDTERDLLLGRRGGHLVLDQSRDGLAFVGMIQHPGGSAVADVRASRAT